MGLFADIGVVLAGASSVFGFTPQGEPMLRMNTNPPSSLQIGILENDTRNYQIAQVYLGQNQKIDQTTASSSGNITSSVLVGVNTIDVMGKMAGATGTFSNAGNITGLLLGMFDHSDQIIAKQAKNATWPHYTIYDVEILDKAITDQEIANQTAIMLKNQIQPNITDLNCKIKLESQKIDNVEHKMFISRQYTGYAELDIPCSSEKLFVIGSVNANFQQESPWAKVETALNKKLLVKTITVIAKTSEAEAAAEKLTSIFKTPNSITHIRRTSDNFFTIAQGDKMLKFDIPQQ